MTIPVSRVIGFLMLAVFTEFTQPLLSQELNDPIQDDELHTDDSVRRWIDSCKKYVYTDYDKTAFFAARVFKRSNEIGYAEGEAHGLMYSGTTHFHKGEFLEALSDLQGSLTAFQERNRMDEIASCRYNIGLIYTKIHDHHKALDYLLAASKAFQVLHDTGGMSHSFNAQGLVHFQTKNYQVSLKHFRNAFRLDSAVSDTLGMAENLGYMAGVYMYQSQLKKAKTIFKECIDINFRFGDKRELATSYNHMGVLYESLDSFAEARNMYTKQIALLDELNTDDGRARAYGNIGVTFYNEEKYHDAKEWISRMLKLAGKQHDTSAMADACFLLSSCHSNLQQMDSAYLFLSEHVELMKAIDRKKISQLQSSFELRFRLDEKEQEVGLINEDLAVSQERNNQLRNRVLILVVLVVFLLALFILYAQVRRQRARINTFDLEQQIWRSRINPHIIFNLLNGVQSFFQKKQYDFGLEYLRKFARMMRLLLEKSDERFHTLEEEVDFLKLYAYTETIRLDNKVEISFKIDEQLEMTNCLVPTFICQSYFENAVWHGASGLREEGRVEVEIRKEDDLIRWYVRDNGKGIDLQSHHNSPNKSDGPHGMELTKSRLLQLNKSHKKGYSVEVRNLNGKADIYKGTEVVFTTPLTD